MNIPEFKQDHTKSLEEQLDLLATRCIEMGMIAAHHFTDPDGRLIMVDHHSVLEAFNRVSVSKV